MPGQKEVASRAASVRRVFTAPAMISPDGKMASMGYAPALINLDITDSANPKLIGQLNFSPPLLALGSQSPHSALPLWDRNLLFVSSEASAERCAEALNFAALVDNRDPGAAPPDPRCCRCQPRRRARRTRTSAKRAAASGRITPTRKSICQTWRSPAT